MKYQIAITSDVMSTVYNVSTAARVLAQIKPIIKGLESQGAKSYKIEVTAKP